MRARELRKDGVSTGLPEQSIKILAMLLERPNEVVLREEIRKKLWPNDTAVEFDHSINAAIKRLRQALGDSPEASRFIETLARRGYRWIFPIQSSADGSDSQLDPCTAIPRTGMAQIAGGLIGRKVSHYRVLEILGGGGMGVVYKAEDLKLGRRVAIKFLPEELGGDPKALERFEREARAASALDHPNICAIHEFGEHDNQPFLVMPLLQGETLRDRIVEQSGPLAVGTLVDIAIQVCEGVNAAHQKGIIHRDIKPANIFLTERGDAKILDFGVAKLLDSSEPAESLPDRDVIEASQPKKMSQSGFLQLTRTGVALGTEGYMSPEQVRGEVLDARTDLFSFGLVLYEMATGRRAFGGDTVAEIHDGILHGAPTPVRQINTGLPHRLEHVICKSLEKAREARYQTASAVGSELKQIRDEEKLEAARLQVVTKNGVTVVPQIEPNDEVLSLQPRLASRIPRRWIWIGLAVIVVASTALGIYSWIPHSGPPNPRNMQITRLTNHGKVVDVAVSPDGRYVIYSLVDGTTFSLRLLHVATRGDVEILSPRETSADFLTFSPDGNNIYFLQGDGVGLASYSLYRMSVLGGAPHLLIRTVDSPVTFSPDGKQLAYARAIRNQRMTEVRLANSDGSSDRLLTAFPGGVWIYAGLAWSPDGHTIVMPVVPKDRTGSALEAISVPGGQVRELYFNTNSMGRPFWLPGGTDILIELGDFQNRGQLWTISYPDGKALRFTNDLANYGSQGTITPDGTTLAVVQWGANFHIWSVDVGNAASPRQVDTGISTIVQVRAGPAGKLLLLTYDGELFLINPDGSQLQPFSEYKTSDIPVWCGKYVLFVARTEGATDLMRVDADGTHPIKLATGNYFLFPNCLQESKFAYVFLVSVPEKIMKVDIETGAILPLANVMGDNSVGQMALSPDGKLLAYPVEKYGQASSKKFQIISTVDGSPADALDASKGSTSLRWSANGQTLQFVAYPKGVPGLWEQPIGSGDPRLITHLPPGMTNSFLWYPDDRHLLVTSGNQTGDVVLLTNLR
ncbi:MAG: protein kinase [Acidobacteriia bacterium]|nr:protein kinase [Terriglobia bacterium]